MFHDSLIDDNLNFASYIMTIFFGCWQAMLYTICGKFETTYSI